FRLMQAVGDQGMGVFVEHGVSFVRLLPGGAAAFPPTPRPPWSPVNAPPPAPKKIKKKKKHPRFFFF
ncbi:hypothetical protein ACVGXB_00445, partial [Enterobacter intestinihominis]